MIKSIAAAVAALLAMSLNASASPLNPESSSVGITYNQATGSSAYGPTYVELDGASASVALDPYASVQAKIGDTYTQLVTADLSYYFEVVGGPVGVSVPVLIATNLLASGTYPQYGGASLSVFDGTTNIAGKSVCTYADCASTQFDGTLSIGARSGTQYEIHLNATAEGVDVFASADPYIFIDPNFVNAADYNIQVSDGVGNTLAATPLPAGFPLFVSALGALGFFAWRKKKCGAAVAA